MRVRVRNVRVGTGETIVRQAELMERRGCMSKFSFDLLALVADAPITLCTPPIAERTMMTQRRFVACYSA